MKRNIVLLLLFVLTASCNDWLEITPKSQISKEKLYSDEIGFQNALNGIYQGASVSDLYGKNLTWGMLTAISQTYNPESLQEAESYFSEYTYDNEYTKPIVTAVWEGLYKLIANCNLLLNEISDASPSLFTLDTVSKNVITGEALALRAFFHFDIIRLYAPAPVTEDETPLIPYQAEWPSEIKTNLGVTAALEEVIKDLLLAKDYLALCDTSFNKSAMSSFDARFNGNFWPAQGGTFMNYRGMRMNYCAVLGMLARVYLYKGDKERAYQYAWEFYNKFVFGKKWFKYNAPYDFTDDLTYRCKKHLSDCLFAFYTFDLLDNYADYTVYWGDPMMIQGVDEIFENDGDDYRKNYLLEKKEDWETTYTSLKYRRVNSFSIDSGEGRVLPNLRMSEIYYILIECLYEKEQAKAFELLQELRRARGCKRIVSSALGISDLQDILINDARREFIGEGQLFFMYKRLNKSILSVGAAVNPSNKVFVFGIPDSQKIY